MTVLTRGLTVDFSSFLFLFIFVLFEELIFRDLSDFLFQVARFSPHFFALVGINEEREK